MTMIIWAHVYTCVCVWELFCIYRNNQLVYEKTVRRFLETVLVGLSMHIKSAFFLISLFYAFLQFLCLFSYTTSSFFWQSSNYTEFYLFVLNCISRGSVKLLKELCSIQSCSCLCILSENQVALNHYLLQAWIEI